MTIQWEDWVPIPDVVTQHVRFTGFGPDGNGDDLLVAVDDLGGNVTGRDGEIEFLNRDGEQVAWAHPGDWIIRGTRGEVYPVTDDVHADKYQRRPS